MKISFIINIYKKKKKKRMKRNIKQVMAESGWEYETVLLNRNDVNGNIFAKVSGEYFMFLDEEYIFGSHWTKRELTDDIYMVEGLSKNRTQVPADIVSGKIDNTSRFLIKKAAISKLEIVSKGALWQVKEAVLRLVVGLASINVITDMTMELVNVDEVKKSCFEEVEPAFEFASKVLCPLGEYNLVSKNYTWVKMTLNDYLNYLKKPLLKLTGENAPICDKIITRLVKCLNEDIIVTSKKYSAQEKVYWLNKMESTKLKKVVEGNNIMYFHDNKLLYAEGNTALPILFSKLESDHIEIEGYVPYIDKNNKPEVVAYLNGEIFEAESLSYNLNLMLGEEAMVLRQGFKIRLNLDSNETDYEISFAMRMEGLTIPITTLQFNKYAPIYGGSKGVYYEKDGWIMKSDTRAGFIYLTKTTPQKLKACKKMFDAELMSQGFKMGLKLRMVYKYAHLMKKLDRKKIWLVSDRTNRTDDNGECFFKYLSKNKKKIKGVKIYFVLDKKCEAAKDMKKYGKLVQPMSFRHKMLHLRSEYVISSQANDPVVNPFLKMQKMYRPLLQDTKFVFLQHGVIKDDLSGWLNRYNRDMYGFVVSTKPEYDSILEYDYRFTPKEVWLTGLPRYDFLYHDEKKYITIMPTWRKTLMAGTDSTTGLWLKGDNFDDSSFVKFYNRLLNDEALIGYCKERGYTLCFMPHPIIAPYVEESFNHHPDVKFVDADMKYRNVFAESDLILTDYSSVAFDFAYLRKPILYAQFDREEFYGGGHSYVEGYFDYEKDGFGKVCTTYDDTVNEIKKAIDNNCVLEDEYRKRIDNTFAFDDKNCSARILEKMLARQ